MQPCSVCVNVRIPYPITHIRDNGDPLLPNPVHPHSPICRECAQTWWDSDRGCPTCRGRFLRPESVKCSYRWLRKTKNRPYLACPEEAYEKSDEDHRFYCSEHIDLGPSEMRARETLENSHKEQQNSRKRQRVADQCLLAELKKTEAATKKAASELYFESLKRGAQVVYNGHQTVVQAATVMNLTYMQAPPQMTYNPMAYLQPPVALPQPFVFQAPPSAPPATPAPIVTLPTTPAPPAPAPTLPALPAPREAPNLIDFDHPTQHTRGETMHVDIEEVD